MYRVALPKIERVSVDTLLVYEAVVRIGDDVALHVLLVLILVSVTLLEFHREHHRTIDGDGETSVATSEHDEDHDEFRQNTPVSRE